MRSVLRLQSRKAGGADAASLEEDDLVGIVAENAGGLILLQDDAISVNEHFECVSRIKLHAGAELLRDQNASELVDLFYKSGRFHWCNLSFLIFCMRCKMVILP